VQLRTEFNRIAPNRDRASDGSIGDPAHQNTVSDHNPDETGSVPIRDADSINEVHAIDVDVDLRVPGLTMERVVQFLLGRCRSGAENRLRYIIYNRRIWQASNGWAQQSYGGANPHTAHAHFSASYDTAREASTASWHLEELVAITDAEIEKIAARVEQRVWNHTEPNPYDNGATNRRMGGDLRMMEYRDDQRALATNVTRLDNQVIPMLRQTLALVSQMAGATGATEPMIAYAVLSGLPPEAIAEAIPPELAKEVVNELMARIE
jgi:hypothetical protein